MSSGIKLGDVIELGRHRLMCGDAFDPGHVDALMQGEKPHMLYCDPPYGMNLDTQWHKRSGPKAEAASMARVGVGSRNYPPVAGDMADFDPEPLIQRFAGCDDQFWWGADYYAERIPKRNDGSWLVWDKRPHDSLQAQQGNALELCWSRRKRHRRIARVLWCGFLGVQCEPDKQRHHPTQKPVALAEWFLDRYSKEGATVVDLFGGAGGTLLACERKGRICQMMELSPDYCQVIIDRYHALTQQPSLALEAVS